MQDEEDQVASRLLRHTGCSVSIRCSECGGVMETLSRTAVSADARPAIAPSLSCVVSAQQPRSLLQLKLAHRSANPCQYATVDVARKGRNACHVCTMSLASLRRARCRTNMATLWSPEALWPLPPNPYVNHTPRPDAREKAKWLVVGLTLFLPRLVVCIVTSTCTPATVHFCDYPPVRIKSAGD